MKWDSCQRILKNMGTVIVGKSGSMELLLVALLADGHALIEDVPGVGKTMMAKSLAVSIGGTFKRVQFTPDLLPTDITGFNIFNQKTGEFQFQPGPVLSNVLLADEINRTVPRTQSSLLESMEERQVTVDGQTIPLPHPFFVIATQNPIELEGTFSLPEAQLDRFLLKVHIDYPDRDDEMAILERFQADDPLHRLEVVVQPEEITTLQEARAGIHVSEPVRAYVTDIIRNTRTHPLLWIGASPRATLALMRASQALAALRGREYVLPDDVKNLVQPVLSHRLILKERERARGQGAGDILEEIVAGVPVPPKIDVP